jgi:hypothetical protein
MANPQPLKIQISPEARELVKAWSFSQKLKISVNIRQVANTVKQNLRVTTPQKTRQLLFSQELRKINDLEFEIIETVDPPYGLFQRQGVARSRINPIFPREKKALFWPGARHPVRAVYNHPGIRPNDYFKKAIEMSKGEIREASERAVQAIEAGVDI